MNLNFNTAYHPESDGKIERVNQVIKEMLSVTSLMLQRTSNDTNTYDFSPLKI